MNIFTKIRGNIISCIIVLIIGIMGCYAGYNIYYNHNESSITYNQKQETVTVSVYSNSNRYIHGVCMGHIWGIYGVYIWWYKLPLN